MKKHQHYKLFTSKDHKTLFEGQFTSFIECLETAVKQRINLEHIDLSHRNLNNANLDDAIMPHANFTHTNLSGANLSESYLKGSIFKNTMLYNTCFCYSNLSECNFEDSLFGATDIDGSIITKSRFSTLSCFSLNFYSTQCMHECVFTSPNTPPSTMSKPPIVINGLKQTPIIITDEHIKAGHNTLSSQKIIPIINKISTKAIENCAAHNPKKNKILTY